MHLSILLTNLTQPNLPISIAQGASASNTSSAYCSTTWLRVFDVCSILLVVILTGSSHDDNPTLWQLTTASEWTKA